MSVYIHQRRATMATIPMGAIPMGTIQMMVELVAMVVMRVVIMEGTAMGYQNRMLGRRAKFLPS